MNDSQSFWNRNKQKHFLARLCFRNPRIVFKKSAGSDVEKAYEVIIIQNTGDSPFYRFSVFRLK